MKTTAIIVAGGAGVRMGKAAPKAFLDLEGRPLVAYSLDTFQSHPAVDHLVLVAPSGHLHEAARIAKAYDKVRAVVAGGARRQDSVRRGLEEASVADADDMVLVHDAARPFATAGLIAAVLGAAARTGAAVPGVPPADTVREIEAPAGGSGPALGARLVPRERLALIQTPQAFRASVLRDAFRKAGDRPVTDDAALVEALGRPVEIVSGEPLNFKITTAEDLQRATALLRSRAERAGPPAREG